MIDFNFDSQTLANLLHDPAIRLYAHRTLEGIGIMAVLPKALAKATPWAMRAADRTADLVLRVPLVRDVVLLFADDIVATLEATSNGIESLVDTFSKQLEARIKEAAEKKSPAPAEAPKPPESPKS